MKFKIDDDIFEIKYDYESKFDEMQEWLKRVELEKLSQYFKTKEINTIDDLKNLSNDYINCLDLNEVEKNIWNKE